jgi:hypothetical protein
VLVALLALGCAEPPHKEMDQAQGAIDAARAAGADRYATTEFTAATAALDSANAAAAGGDYRLALNHALESREQAQNAARTASETRARLRGDLERSMAELTVRLAQTRSRLSATPRTRAAAVALKRAGEELAAADTSLQEAGKAIGADDYAKATPALDDARARLEKAVGALETPPSQSPRRRG